MATRESELKQRQKDFQLQFFNKQMALYFDACECTGRLAASADKQSPQDLEHEIEQFYVLYWGSRCAVEDVHVEQSMVKFEPALRAWIAAPSAADLVRDLKQSSYQLAHRCRDSLDKTFMLELGALSAEKPADAAGGQIKPSS
ncbi:MAG: hypothetical protein K1X74_10820 [Pirellulales bacterium]|nr:hypothetical protein [Pirellulales bacterium]